MIVLSLLLIMPSHGITYQGDKLLVKSSGVAAIFNSDVEKGRKDAILHSMKSAVQQAGPEAVSGTVVENFSLVEDKIIANAGNYVQSYQIMEEGQRDGKYEVTIAAEVNRSAIVNDATAIYSEMKKPRIMVVIPEIRGKDVIPSSHAENVVSEFFVEKGFTMIDQETVKENIKKDEIRKIAEGDEKAAVKLGLRSGAEVVVVGSASLGDIQNVRKVLYSSKATVSMRAIRTDNASMYAISNQSKPAADGIADAAQRKALETSSRSAAQDIFWKVVKKWNEELMKGTDVEVVVSGVDFAYLRKLIDQFRDIQGVQEVMQRSFDAPTAVLNVTFKGDSMHLAENIYAKKFDGFDIKVSSVSSGKLNLQLVCHTRC